MAEQAALTCPYCVDKVSAPTIWSGWHTMTAMIFRVILTHRES